MPIFETELPGVLVDALAEDNVPATAGQTPVLINLDPEPLETRVPKSTNVSIDIATIDSVGTIDVSATRVFVDDVLAFNGGLFTPDFGGPESSYGFVQDDVLRVVLDRATDFQSQAIVTVRVVTKAVGDSNILDTTYTFTIDDTTAPRIASAEATDLMRVEVTFNEAIRQTLEASGALEPDNWHLDRMGDYLTPLVAAEVIDVQLGTDEAKVILVTDIPLTPGGVYRATASNIEDASGNVIEAPDNFIDFFGWTPPAPAGRAFKLYEKIPAINRREDTSGDLKRWVGCLQEVATLLLYDIDRFLDILDPDIAPEAYVDAMLADLGNPFDFELTLVDKRRLLNVLVRMYQLKGTAVGIVDVVRFFLGLEVEVDPYNRIDNVWMLGESLLGESTILGTNVSALLYSFEVSIDLNLTPDQRSQIMSIVEYMKPAHTHFVALREPLPPPEVLDHLVLGESRLGENWLLH